MIVADASVIVKWFLPEDASPRALMLHAQEHTIIAPDIISIEVCGAITRRHRQGALEKEDALAHIARWERILENSLVETLPSSLLLADAALFSLRLKHPLADCLYLASAKLHNCPLITADRILHTRAQDCGVEVRLLSAA